MARIQPIVANDTDVSTASTLADVKAKLGMVPNLFATLAHSPTALHAYLQLSETLAGGRLTSAQRESIALAVAQTNACQYCLSAHTAMAKGAGLDSEAIERARQGGAANAVDAAIVTFARLVTEKRGVISDSDLASLREAGVDDALVMEIVVNVVLNILTNYVNHIADTEIDFPVVELQAA